MQPKRHHTSIPHTVVMTDQPKPLWQLLHETLKDAWSGGANTREAHAVEIEALANEMVPEEPEVTDPYQISDEEIIRREERQRIRTLLLEQARIAREGV
jgi:hypothetical protein